MVWLKTALHETAHYGNDYGNLSKLSQIGGYQKFKGISKQYHKQIEPYFYKEVRICKKNLSSHH